MRIFLVALSAVLFTGALAFAEGEMGMGGETHGYGGMYGGYMGLWLVYGLIKTGVVIFSLWLLLRITRAVERIAGSRP